MSESIHELLRESPLKDQWQKIGAHNHYGIDLHLSSLVSKKSSGVGEYLDLIPLIDWCSKVGFDVIQLLPLNDSGEDPSPYNALTSLGLHPLYISLWDMPFLDNDAELQEKMEALKKYNLTNRVDYNNIYHKKQEWLHRYYEKYFSKFKDSKEFLDFIYENPWCKDYGLYKALKETMSLKPWREWPPKLRHPSKDTLQELKKIHHDLIAFHIFLQFFCARQLKKVKAHAESAEVFIKGDIPILISPDSSDVWIYPKYFDLSFSVGSPPDIYTKQGQHWGFPAFIWGAMKDDNYAWWQRRLQTAANYYHLYRLDHVAGFYRLWLIPDGQPPTKGFFVPKEVEAALHHGHNILDAITKTTSMLPIAEDLGIIPECVFSSLRSLGIPGMKFMRKEFEEANPAKLKDFSSYYPLSMTCVSTHDSETIAMWWRDYPKEAKAYCNHKGFTYDPVITKEQIKSYLKDSMETSSLFHINLLSEYFAPFPDLVHDTIDEERINQPGLILPTNWTYRFKKTIEEFSNHEELNDFINSIIPKK